MKETTYRSKKYRTFIESQDCIIVENYCRGDVVAHHSETGGVGLKGSDLSCIPLCNYHHDKIHRKGKGSFEASYNVDIWRLVQQMNWEYIKVLEKK